VATVARGKGLFDIDLAGGTSVTFILKQPMEVGDVRARLEKVLPQVEDPTTNTNAQFTAYELSLTGEKEQKTVYKVDCSLQDIETLKAKVREAFRTPDGKDLLKTYHLEVSKLEEGPAEKPPADAVLKAPETPAKAEPQEKPPAEPKSGEKSNEKPAAPPEKSGGCSEAEEQEAAAPAQEPAKPVT